MNRSERTKDIILIAMFAAVTAVLSQISIPLPFSPIPFNLATFAVCLTGGVLGAKKGALSMLIFVFMGIAGLPVFSNFGAGIGKLAGPTGGYIIGYIAMAFVIGLLRDIKKDNTVWLAFSMQIGMIVLYIFGSIWFVYSTAAGLTQALLLCVIPFIPGDTIKIILAATVTKRLHGINGFSLQIFSEK